MAPTIQQDGVPYLPEPDETRYPGLSEAETLREYLKSLVHALNEYFGTLKVDADTLAVAPIGPLVVVKSSADQTAVAATTFTKVTFDTEIYDTDACFASSTFTPNKSGYYRISSTILFKSALTDQARLYAQIYKNGAIHIGGPGMCVSGTDQAGCSVNGLVFANGTTDYFEIYVYHTSTGDEVIYGNTAYTHLECEFIMS